MRLVLITFEPFWYDGKRYSTNSNFINFLLAFKKYFDEIILLVPVQYMQREKGKMFVDLGNTEVRALPFHKNLLDMYWKLPFTLFTTIGKVKRAVEESDIVFIDEQHIQSTLLYGLINYSRKNIFFWIRADIEKSFENLGYSGIKEVIAKIFARIHLKLNKAMASRYPTFVVGDKAYRKYRDGNKKAYKTHISLVLEKHILPRSVALETSQRKGINLLSLGRLTPVKGLNYLIEALPLVVKKTNVSIRLLIVGSGGQEGQLRKKVKENNLSGYVTFAGYIPFESEVLRLYTEADIFLSSSLSEGFPQTFFEAMARGTAIISTNVGGIPDIIKEGVNGLLITPRDSQQIADAIIRLIENTKLRARLIENGIETVKKYTLEAQIKKIMSRIFQSVSLKKHFGETLINN